MLTVNDQPVLTLDFSLKKVGNWVLDVQVDADEALSGDVVLLDAEGNEFKGTVYRSNLHVGRVWARILGGKGKLGTLELDAAHYQSATGRFIAEDIIARAGETIDPNSAPLTTTLDYWSHDLGTGQRALTSLAERLGVSWRVLPNGKVWLGTDSSDPVVLPSVLELDRDGIRGTVELGLDALVLLPGEVFGGERIQRILYCQSDDKPLRATVWPEAA